MLPSLRIAASLLLGVIAVSLPSAAAFATDYTLVKQFTPGRGNEQGLGFNNGTHYVGYASSDPALGRIRAYSANGTLLSDTGLIGVGHCAEIAWSSADNSLYVANGGATNPTHVYRVDPVSGAITRDYDFASLGNNGMVAVDNAVGNLKLFHGPVAPDNNYRISDLAYDGTVGSEFVVPKSLGVPQGIEVVGDRILYLYSKPMRDKGKNHYNWINVYSQAGVLLETISLSSLTDESQGLSLDPADNTIYVGAKSPNAVYKLQPAFGTPPPPTALQFRTP